MSKCSIHCSPKMLQIHVLHLSHHLDKHLIIHGELLWKDGWHCWNQNLKTPGTYWMGGGGLLTRNPMIPLNLNLRTMRYLLNLMNCRNMSSQVLSSYTSTFLGHILQSLLNHMCQNILINLRSRGLHMLISILSSSSGSLSTVNSPLWRHLKRKEKWSTSAENRIPTLKGILPNKKYYLFLFLKFSNPQKCFNNHLKSIKTESRQIAIPTPKSGPRWNSALIPNCNTFTFKIKINNSIFWNLHFITSQNSTPTS